MSNGPVCHIPPANTPANPQPHDIPGIPAAINPKSPAFNNDVANALNAFRQILMAITGQLDALRNRQPTNNNNSVTNNIVPKQAASQWTQQSVVTETVRVYQNNDKTSDNWVDVERINKLVMVDNKTGQKWTWNRNG
jgi:hypothetical protein